MKKGVNMMKNIYDIFEQRKIDCINCDYRNILETYEELDMLYNMLDNEHYDCLEEAFDFKKMKDSVKSGARIAGKAIGSMINKAVEILKELLKKIKTWFNNIKNHLFKKKSIEEIVEEKLENALNDNNTDEDKKPERTEYKREDNDNNTKKDYPKNNDEKKAEYEKIKNKRKKLEYDLYHGNVGRTKDEIDKMKDDIDFLEYKEKEYLENKRLENKHRDKNWNDKKKEKNDIQIDYKNKQRNERKFDKNRKPSIQEILHHMANMSFKSTPIVDCDKISDEFVVVMEVIEILENLYVDEVNADYNLMEELKKERIIDNGLEDIVNSLAPVKTPMKLTLGNCSKKILTYVNSQDIIKKRISKIEAKVDKTLGKKIREMEGFSDEQKNSEFVKHALRINREAMSICTKMIQLLSGLYNSEYNKVESIVSQATDKYIKEVLKR
jgi:hypothetical protein